MTKRATPKRGAGRRALHAQPLVDFTAALAGWGYPVAHGVGYDGAAYVVAARPSTEQLTVEHGLGVFPKTRRDRPLDHLVLRWSGENLEQWVVPSVAANVSFVQPLGAEVLLASARCHASASGPEHNGLVVDRRGAVTRTLVLGDGLADVRTTPDGDIWLSYFDEGVYGNYGWQQPMGASGLVQLDASGAVRFEYDASSAGTGPIDDVYATNLTPSGDLWIYFYSDFALVRVHADRYERFASRVEGARAVAIADDRALLVGTYGHPDHGTIVSLRRGARAAPEAVRIQMESRGSLASARLVARGDTVWVFDGRSVSVLAGW